jgi:hypothetical protein
MSFQPRIHENGNFCCAAYNAAGEPIPSPSQCPKCDAYFAALEQGELRTAEHTDDDAKHYPPQDPYARDLTTLRAAAAPLSTFEADYRAARLRDLQAMRMKLDAEQREPRHLAAEELARFAPPRPYDLAIAALRERERR